MNLDSLERRRLLSVTVYQGYPGFYEVYGDGLANNIEISVSMAWNSFTLNGTSYGGLEHLAIAAYGGDDVIRVSTDDGPGYIGASIFAGDGNDIITLNFDGAIWAGEGNDTLHLIDSFRGEAYGEGGNDYIRISGDTVDAEIIGGDGNDYLDASYNNFGVVMRGGNGDDTLIGSNFDDILYGDDGNDVLYGRAGYNTLYT